MKPRNLITHPRAAAVAGAMIVALAMAPLVAQRGQAPAGRQGGPQPGAFPRVATLPFPTEPQVLGTLGTQIRVVPVVSGLANPWSMAFLPNGDMLVTERAGRLRIVRGGKLDPTPVSGVPTVVASGQGGLLEVALHPQFATNQFIYLTYSKPGDLGNTTALLRGKFDGTAITEARDIFVAEAWSKATQHFGSKIAFGRDGMLYMTVGERNDRTRAQDVTNHGGKVLRLRDDGTAAPDNPLVGRAGAKPEIYSYGHRNLQGLAFHPTTGDLWETEHGPQGGDELNMIVAGKNYGWPVATFGREYSGQAISERPWREDVEAPATVWVPSIGLSGMLFYTGNAFPEWQGNLFLGGLSGLTLQRVGFAEGGKVLAGRETMLFELKQRIRDVRQGPDGMIYVATDSNPGGVLRIEPAAQAAR